MKHFLAWSFGLVALLLVTSGVGQASPEAALTFEQAWVRAMPPGMKMTAGFGQLHNAGDEAVVVVAVSSPQFAEVSLHRSELVDGVARMREVPEIELGPGETLDLEPGGYHLMLMMPTGAWTPDGPVRLSIATREGATFEFEAPVERR